jgi:copper transport protein
VSAAGSQFGARERFARGPLAALLVVLTLLVGCVPSFAHAALLATDPEDGAVVATAPKLLTLEFNETVAPVTLRLIAPDGHGLVLVPRTDGVRLIAPAPAALGRGTYALSWRVISADGHPVGGTSVFSIGAPSAGGVAAPADSVDWPVRVGIWTTRVLTYLAFFVGIGGVFFAQWIGADHSGRPVRRAVLVVGVVALIASIGLQGLDVLDRPLADLASADVWREGTAASFGLFAGFGLLGYVLALLAGAGLGLGPTLALGALLCVGLALALTGHASAADPQWLTRPAVFIHTSVVAFWVGALLPLWSLLRGPPEPAIAPLRRFAGTIPSLLVLLVAAGIALAVVQFGAPSEILTTDYGRVFLAKMALVALLLGLAAFNRWGLTGAVLTDAGLARRRLAMAIGLELGLVVAILGVVALWRFTPPPRALLAAAAEPAVTEIEGNGGMAEITATPGRTGAMDIVIQLMADDGGPLDAKGVTVDFANAEKGIEPIEREATHTADDLWHVSGLTLPVAGTWQVEVDVLVSDFKELDLSGAIEIRP